jgi:hypothetical protein
MNIKQKMLVEKAIKIRYNGLIDSLQRTESVVEAENSGIHCYVREPDTEPAHLPTREMKEAYKLLVETGASLEKMVRTENERRQRIRDEARRQRVSIIEALRRERDDKILKVAFEGEPKDVLAQLKELPTAKDVLGRLGALKLTGTLRDNAGIGDEVPTSLSVE